MVKQLKRRPRREWQRREMTLQIPIDLLIFAPLARSLASLQSWLSVASPSPSKLTSAAGHRKRRDQRERREDAPVGARHVLCVSRLSKKGEAEIEKKKKVRSFRRVAPHNSSFFFTANQKKGKHHLPSFFFFLSLLSFQSKEASHGVAQDARGRPVPR